MNASVAKAFSSLLFAIAIASAGCRKQEKEADTCPLVAASFFPLYDFARELGGTNFNIVCLVPPGGDPHAMEASPALSKTVARAELVLLLGLGMDGWVEKLAVAEKRRSVQTSAGLPVRQESVPSLAADSAPSTAGSHASPADSVDPHMWLDPVLARQIVNTIAAQMTDIAPEHREFVEARRQRLVAGLTQLDREFDAVTKSLPRRQLVTFHGAFAYLFARYQLETVGVIELFPGNEPSAAYLRRLVDSMRRLDLKVIFAEPQLPDRPAQIIAREIGGRVERLDPCETILPEAPEETYLTRQRRNLETLRRVLTEPPSSKP